MPRLSPGYRRVLKRSRPVVTSPLGTSSFASMTKARLHAKTLANSRNSSSWPALVEDPISGDVFAFIPDASRPFGWQEFAESDARTAYDLATR